MVAHASNELDLCPFIDDDRQPCASHFTLQRLSLAMNHCAGGYRFCKHYQALSHDPTPRLTHLTAHGQPLQPMRR